MDVTSSLEPLINLSQVFGLVAFEVRHENGRRVLTGSRKRLAYSRTLFVVFCVLQGMVMGRTVMESFLDKGTVMAKTIRLLHILTFTVSLTAMHLTVMTKGSELCNTLNSVNRLSLLLPKKGKCQETLSLNPKLLFCVFLYFPTIFIGSVRTVFSYDDGEWYKVFRSSYFALNAWLENLFQSQFLMIANAMRAVVIGYNENFERLPRDDKRRAIEFIHKMKSSDMFLKSAFHIINSAYEYNMLFGTSWYFMALIYFVNKKSLQINFVFWTVYIAFKMSSVLAVCHLVNHEVEKTAHHLHELFIDVDDPFLKEEIEIFSLQLMHRKAEFNACGFFKLDFSLLHSMIATVSTYIIILMQLQGDSKLMECIQVDQCTNCTTNFI